MKIRAFLHMLNVRLYNQKKNITIETYISASIAK